jgi:NADH:ubiquinone oxidoreductase subunit F (NADH-binding)/Pyruvate/2-oxoacid:ferredoxin oxidoreductase delta subunit/(2Fe-2S) ferredoxin
MSQLNDNKCCDECWHQPEKPCHDLIECLSDKPHCHDSKDCNSEYSNKIAKLRYDVVDKPVFFLGSGTCGLGAGAGNTKKALKRYLVDHKIDAEIVEVGCIGTCALEPILDIQLPGKSRLSFKRVTDQVVADIVDGILEGNIIKKHVMGQHRNPKLAVWDGLPFLDEIPFFKYQTRWVLSNCGIINPIKIEEYIARNGFKALSKSLKLFTQSELCEQIEKSGLRGRGGGGFSTGKKWKLAQQTTGKEKYFICNADEGDPGAFMDRAVIEGDPFKLIEGLTIASYAIGANKAYVYIRAEYPLAIEHLKEAIEQAKNYGLLGNNILDSGFNLEIIIKKGAGAFVCGEETALINSIEGKRGMPRPRPPYPSESGVFGKPTIINNVETLANVPEIILNGPDWFSSVGTETSKGTKVFALSGHIKHTGLVEVAMGTPIKQIIYDIGGGIPNDKAFKAVQIGGPSGGCIPSSHINIDIDYESLKTVGAMMGSGGLVVMNEDTCMVDMAKYFMDFIQRESCGKCIPCREGTRRMLEILESITSNDKHINSSKLERFQSILHLNSLAEVIQNASLCGLGKSAPNPVLSTLFWFRDEYEAHLYEKTCPAKVCKELLTYKILDSKCTGCTICSKKCPTNAIVGVLKNVHHIIPDKCIGCGACQDTCRFEAIEVA